MAAVVDDRKMKSEMAASGAVPLFLHMMKCRRRDKKCPIQKWTSSRIVKHYAKCRERLDGQASCVYDCSKIRANMKWSKEKYFNESLMSLQLLATSCLRRPQR